MSPLATVRPGVEIAWEERGQGEPVLMLMGIGMQLVHWPGELLTRA